MPASLVVRWVQLLAFFLVFISTFLSLMKFVLLFISLHYYINSAIPYQHPVLANMAKPHFQWTVVSGHTLRMNYHSPLQCDLWIDSLSYRTFFSSQEAQSDFYIVRIRLSLSLYFTLFVFNCKNWLLTVFKIWFLKTGSILYLHIVTCGINPLIVLFNSYAFNTYVSVSRLGLRKSNTCLKQQQDCYN